MLYEKEMVSLAKTTTQIGLRVTDEFKERIAVQAEKERRTISNLIINVLTDYLDQAEQKESAE